MTMCTWDALSVNANRMKQSLNSTRKCLSHVFLLEQQKNYRCGKKPHAQTAAWSYDMEQHARKCVERYCELATRKWSSTKFQALAWMVINSSRKNSNQVGELAEVCSHIVYTCLNLSRIGRPDILWSVNKLARSVTKWTQACDRRLARLISYIHHTNDCRQYCHVGKTAQHCRLGLFQDSDFAGDLEDSKSTSGGVLCFF